MPSASGTAAADAGLFRQVFALLDSDQQGERQAALEKLCSLRRAKNWPTFRDLIERLENTVPLAAFQACQGELTQWRAAHDALVQNNATLKRNIAVLRSAVWVNTNWYGLRRLACWAVVAGLAGFGGYRLYHMLPETKVIAGAHTAQAAEDRAFRDVLSRTRWGQGDTPPAVLRVGDVPYWIIINGDTDATSHADSLGRAVTRNCLHLHADKAVPDAGAYLTPRPRNALGFIAWPLRATECRTRMPDGSVVRSDD